MKLDRYICELCREERDSANTYALIWNGEGLQLLDDAEKSSKHLCAHCLGAMEKKLKENEL